MTYWNNILYPLIGDNYSVYNIVNTLNKEALLISVRIGDDTIEPEQQYTETDSVWVNVTEVTLETKKTWILLRCHGGKVIKVEEENDRGEVKVPYEVTVSFRKDKDVLVSEEYGYRTWMWTPSRGVEKGEELLEEFMNKMDGYFLIADARHVDPEGEWKPLWREHDEHERWWWETIGGIKVDNVPEANTGEYFMHIHEREDSYFGVRNPPTQEEIDKRNKFFEEMFINWNENIRPYKK